MRGCARQEGYFAVFVAQKIVSVIFYYVCYTTLLELGSPTLYLQRVSPQAATPPELFPQASRAPEPLPARPARAPPWGDPNSFRTPAQRRDDLPSCVRRAARPHGARRRRVYHGEQVSQRQFRDVPQIIRGKISLELLNTCVGILNQVHPRAPGAATAAAPPAAPAGPAAPATPAASSP